MGNLEQQLQQIKELALNLFDGEDAANEWLNTPNPLFFDKTPLDYAHDVNAQSVLDILKEWSEEPSYPTFDELKAWLDTKTEHLDPEDLKIVDSCFERANKYGLEWEIMYTAHRSRDVEGANIVEDLLDACDDWDI